ncbi:adenylate/guanylate cyclase domain-containing protein [Helcobacillus massiliensis]|uniref:Adenylate cyclase n=1 Tax=Helcobacillus massiliensis TaxID=521392 RepID=A0A839QX47_9MICO|nr:adenylate/guanylate cyclase domain-containing protein [Helcobacillus massiliensis]MBB3021947.1 adenylate cyclase [Helcobacillus massiliensis]
MSSAEPSDGAVPTVTAEMSIPQQLNRRFARVRQSVGALERVLLQGPRTHSARELQALHGLPESLVAKYWRGMGFGGIDHDIAVFTDEDAEAIGELIRLVTDGEIDEDTFVNFARGFGFHTGRLAMWLTEALVDEAKAGGKVSDSQARMLMLERAPEFLGVFERQVVYAFRRQMASYTARAGSEILRSVGESWSDEALPLPRAVAFADLVQFTRLAQSIDGFELADVIKQFEGLCRDIISEGGGRVVKTVGDEMMFLADTPEDGVRIALSITEAVAASPILPAVRVGLTWGNMFSRYGDVFGPRVNLAARLEGIAEPGAVVVDLETAETVDRAFPGGFSRAEEWSVELQGIGLTTVVRLERAAASRIVINR